MSRIALTPNASGTGTLTIAAPNTNADRTLTLPDATGTVNISGLANQVPAGSAGAPAIYPTGDTNTGVFFPAADTVAIATNGVERMRVQTGGYLSGYVGVNTTSPSAPLNVAVYGTSNVPGLNAVVRIEQGPLGASDTALQIVAPDQSYGYPSIHFGVGARASSTRLASFGGTDGFLIQDQSGGPITFMTSGGNVRIDSAGRVTMPYQPAFSAKHTATEGPGTNSPLTQWGVQVNVGGGAFSNGRYTAPIAGNYLISLSLLQNTGTGSSGVNLTKNGSIIYRVMYAVTGYGYQMASGTYILSLAANDYIEFTNEVGGIQWYGDATGLGAMTVQLIG